MERRVVLVHESYEEFKYYWLFQCRSLNKSHFKNRLNKHASKTLEKTSIQTSYQLSLYAKC